MPIPKKILYSTWAAIVVVCVLIILSLLGWLDIKQRHRENEKKLEELDREISETMSELAARGAGAVIVADSLQASLDSLQARYDWVCSQAPDLCDNTP